MSVPSKVSGSQTWVRDDDFDVDVDIDDDEGEFDDVCPLLS